MTSHSQIGDTAAKIHIPLQRLRIVSQFLHWNFEGKKGLDYDKFQKSLKMLVFGKDKG